MTRRERPAPSPTPGVCRLCGCTDENACSEDGISCSWSNQGRTLCTFCHMRDGPPEDGPQSPEDWQLAVNMADALGRINEARAWRLIDGGPEIDPDRCADLVERGAALGYRPSPWARDAIVATLAGL